MFALAAYWISAAGSFAAVVTALYIAIRGQRRTRVSLEFEQGKGDVTLLEFKIGDDLVREVWLRIRLRNRGRSLADAAQIFPTIVRSNGDYDVRSSKWFKVSGLPLSKAPIPPGADRYFDVGFMWSGADGRPAMALLRVGETPGDWHQEKKSAQDHDSLAPGVLHEIFVLGTCSNSDAKYGYLSLRFDADKDVGTSAISCEFERLTRRAYLRMAAG